MRDATAAADDCELPNHANSFHFANRTMGEIFRRHRPRHIKYLHGAQRVLATAEPFFRESRVFGIELEFPNSL